MHVSAQTVFHVIGTNFSSFLVLWSIDAAGRHVVGFTCGRVWWPGTVVNIKNPVGLFVFQTWRHSLLYAKATVCLNRVRNTIKILCQHAGGPTKRNQCRCTTHDFSPTEKNKNKTKKGIGLLCSYASVEWWNSRYWSKVVDWEEHAIITPQLHVVFQSTPTCIHTVNYLISAGAISFSGRQYPGPLLEEGRYQRIYIMFRTRLTLCCDSYNLFPTISDMNWNAFVGTF